MKSIRFVAAFVTLVVFFTCPSAGAGQGDIYTLRVNDAISPAIADFLAKGIRKADLDQAACLIVELDTPGGLVESTRRIVMAVYAARTPVVVYVSPSGARAA